MSFFDWLPYLLGGASVLGVGVSFITAPKAKARAAQAEKNAEGK